MRLLEKLSPPHIAEQAMEKKLDLCSVIRQLEGKEGRKHAPSRQPKGAVTIECSAQSLATNP